MPISQHDRSTSLFFTPLTTLVTALGITEPVLEWGWEGTGLTGWVVARWDPEDIPGNPRPGVTKRIFSETLFLFGDVKEAFLPSVPDAAFIRMTMSFDVTNAYFNLNREE